MYFSPLGLFTLPTLEAGFVYPHSVVQIIVLHRRPSPRAGECFEEEAIVGWDVDRDFLTFRVQKAAKVGRVLRNIYVFILYACA